MLAEDTTEGLAWVSPSKLKPWKRNPRKNSHAVKNVMASIRKFGFGAPLIVDQDFRICGGHTRLKAALELGLERVPIRQMELTEDQFVALSLADNKTGELASWDMPELGRIISEMEDSAREFMAEVGFTGIEMQAALDAAANEIAIDLPDGDIEEKPDMDKITIFVVHEKKAAVSKALRELRAAIGVDDMEIM